MKGTSKMTKVFLSGFTLCLLLSLTIAWASVITLDFASLPSAQGWTYVSDGAPEASIFSVSGGVLTQNTASFAGAATIQFYQRSAVSPSLPFTIKVRARILADSTTGAGQPNAFGFCFTGAAGTDLFGIGLDTGRIQAINGVVLSTAIDNTQFHDYRLEATPGVGYEFYVDDVLLATGPPLVGANSDLLQLGDCTRGQGALAEVMAYSFRQVLPVAIDIKPGSFPNSINPRSIGVIPVAILTTGTFDATMVEPTTVRFGATGTEAAAVHSTLEDVNGDGKTDLILQFRTQGTGILCGNTSASLTGETFSGQAISGSDSVNTVGCK